MEKLKPNFTQTPNVFYDEIMADLGYAELKCLLYIFRRTYGFHKQSDRISLSQFVDGIDGLDRGTGLAKKNVYPALESLVEKKLIKKDTSGKTTRYSLYLLEPLKVGTQSTQTRYAEYPEVGTQSTIQKKEKESIQKKDIATTKSSTSITTKKIDEVSELISLFENVDQKNKRYYGNKTQRSACKFLIETYSFDNVVKVVNLLQQTNTQEYFPRITSPYELQEKWQKLAIALSSAQRKDNELVNQMII